MESEKDVKIFLNETPKASEPVKETPPETQPPQAFNEETGEINWDCPCLGNMTQPPCGETFKAAFSCFVYSKEEPKGADCVELFREMQDCFQKYPEIYGSEIDDDKD
jgi:intermembrane space import and assembly protein 40